MFENSDVPLLQNKKSKKDFLCKYAIFFTFICGVVVLSTLALAGTRRETPIGDINAYRHAEDDIPTPREVESDDAEEIEVGAIAKAAGAEVQLCEELKAFTSDLSDITEGKPLFGEELEYHNEAVSLDNGKWLYTTDGKKKSGGAGWGYTKILGYVKHADLEEPLITIEGETQTRVEAFTAPVSPDGLIMKKYWLCAYELLAKLRDTQGKGTSLKDAINKLLTGLSTNGACNGMSNKLSVEYLLDNDGGKAAYDIESAVAQLNFGVPIAVFDPMTIGNTAKNSYYNEKKPCRKKGYEDRIPKGLEGLWPLNKLSKKQYKDDVAKLQLIQDPIVRALTAFWREIHLTLAEAEAEDGGDKPYWKKKDFKIFPKHKFTGSEKIFIAASGAYDKLFPGEKYGVGHLYKQGSPSDVKPQDQWKDYGTTIRKDPWTGIRLNYADNNDKKSIEVVQSDGQFYVVMETRADGSIKDKLPGTKDYQPTTNTQGPMKEFWASMKEIQTFTSNVQGRCGDKPGDKYESH